MKPTSDMLTTILSNFRVNGKFAQDQLKVGRGIDEQIFLQLGEASAGIPTVTWNNQTFYRRTDLDQQLSGQCSLVYGNTKTGDPTATLYCSNGTTWYGENWYNPAASIGANMPSWESTGGTADSPEGTVWGNFQGSSKPYTSTFEVIDRTDPPGIRYTPGVTGERTFTMMGTPDHPVFDEQSVLRPYPKPVNEFTNMWVLAEEDTIWVSDEFSDTSFSGMHYIMYIGAADGPSPNKWRVHTISNGDGELGLNWGGSNTYDFLGAQENVTWSNGEASAYPSSPDDWSTSGYQGVKPSVFSMTATEGSDPKLEYSADGATWQNFAGGNPLAYTPIPFTGADLDASGKLHIQHNFGHRNVLCLGYDLVPRDIEYLENEIVLDYGDRESGGGATPDETYVGPLTVSGVTIPTAANGEYTIEDASKTDVDRSWTNGTYYIWGRHSGGQSHWVLSASKTYMPPMFSSEGAAETEPSSPWNMTTGESLVWNALQWTGSLSILPAVAGGGASINGVVWFIGSDPSML